MKKTLLLTVILAATVQLFGQQFQTRNLHGATHSPELKGFSPGGEAMVPPYHNSQILTNRTLEENIGITRFNPQTVGTMGRRVVDNPDGTVSATWLYGIDEAGGWPDRGTAYNHFDGNEWGDFPESRVEQTRSGYPSFTRLPDGTDVLISHKNTTATQYYLTAHIRKPGETSFTEHEIPSTVTGGPVWAKVTTGGDDGNTLHVVAVSLATAFGGVVHEGLDQHPLYYRSLDGGTTWDIVDAIIPGLDSTGWLGVDGEAYNIDANGETVAIGVFDSWGDVAVYKSLDNGQTWEKSIVKDFPLDKYDGTGYTADDIPLDANAPSTIAMLTSDGSGSVAVGNDGKVHVFFPWMYVEATDATFNLYLSMSGMAYWNEDMATDEISTIADLEDFDGDTLITVAGNLDNYRYSNTGLTTYPVTGVDAEGNIYLVYMALREDFVSIDDQNYRHLFVIKSEDSGETWSAPFDLINPELVEEVEFIEAAYPSIPARVSDGIHLLYMQDYVAGPITTSDNYMMYMKVDKNTFGIISDAPESEKPLSGLTLSPNPAHGKTAIGFELQHAAEVQISLLNLMGETVWEQEKWLPSGKQREILDIQNLSAGIYFVKMETEGQLLTQKLVVRG